MNRREFLGSTMIAGGLLLSGCSGKTNAASLKQANKSALKRSTIKDSPSEYIYKGTGHLENGEFTTMSFWSRVDFQFKWDVDVTNGTLIDVWVMRQRKLKSFQQQRKFSYQNDLSKAGIRSSQVSARLTPGEYFIILENSDAYKTESKGAVDFELQITQLPFEPDAELG